MSINDVKLEIQGHPDIKRLFEVDDKFPVAYSYPEENAQWICDYDMDGKLTSVVRGHGEKYVTYINSAEEFYSLRNEMEGLGWLRCAMPKVTVSFNDSKVKKPSRKERRLAERADVHTKKIESTLRRSHPKPNTDAAQIPLPSSDDDTSQEECTIEEVD